MVDEDIGFKIFELRGHFYPIPLMCVWIKFLKMLPLETCSEWRGSLIFFGPSGLKFFVGIRWGLFASREWQYVLKITLYLSDCKLCWTILTSSAPPTYRKYCTLDFSSACLCFLTISHSSLGKCKANVEGCGGDRLLKSAQPDLKVR